MFAIYLKELNTFFSSLIGYLTMGVFLLIMGLFVWVFPDTSVLSYEYATLDYFFTTAPWVLMFLVPAITMRSLAEERHSGTMELLVTRPLSDWQIIFGKFLAAFTLIAICILPTLIYFFSVYQLGAEVGNIDTGATMGSYIGLMLLAGAFVAIGLFTSSITSNQIVAFLGGVFLCFFFFAGFDFLSRLDVFFAKVDDVIENVGILSHYTSISRGVVDTRDLVYFFTFSGFFLLLAKIAMERRKF